MVFFNLRLGILYWVMATFFTLEHSFSSPKELEDMNVRRISTNPLVKQLSGSVLISGVQEERFKGHFTWFKKQALGNFFTIDYKGQGPISFSADQQQAMNKCAQEAIDLTIQYSLPVFEGLGAAQSLQRVVDREHMLFVIRRLNISSENMDKLRALEGQKEEVHGVFSFPVNRLTFEFFSLDLRERDLFEEAVIDLFRLPLKNPKEEGWSLIQDLAHRLQNIKDKTHLNKLVTYVTHQACEERGGADLDVSFVARLITLAQEPFEIKINIKGKEDRLT